MRTEKLLRGKPSFFAVLILLYSGAREGQRGGGLQMGILLIGIGCVCLALGVWGEHFYEGEGPGLRPSQRRRLSTGQGRIIFLVVGVAFIVIGIERLMYA